MQLHHYRWTYDVNIFNLFVSQVGDTMEQVGPDQYLYHHTATGDTCTLSFSDLAIADFLRRDYIVLEKTVGKSSDQEFKSIIRNEAGVEDVLKLEASSNQIETPIQTAMGVDPIVVAPASLEVEPAEPEPTNPLAEALMADEHGESSEESVIEQTIKTVKRGRPSKKGK